MVASQKAQDEASAEAPAPALAGGGRYLPVVLVDVANHLDDLVALDRAGIRVCSIYTVRPHGPQTTRKKGAAKGARACFFGFGSSLSDLFFILVLFCVYIPVF